MTRQHPNRQTWVGVAGPVDAFRGLVPPSGRTLSPSNTAITVVGAELLVGRVLARILGLDLWQNISASQHLRPLSGL